MDNQADHSLLYVIDISKNDFAIYVIPESSVENGTFPAVYPEVFYA